MTFEIPIKPALSFILSAPFYAIFHRYFSCAAARGMKKAIYNLGVCYVTGKGVGKNESEGLKLIKRAAESRHPKAM